MAPGEALPRSATVDDPDFRPERQMAENGRLQPRSARRCAEGMVDRFDPTDPDFVAFSWRAAGEFFHFVHAVLPALVDFASTDPKQASLRTKYRMAADIEAPNLKLGGVLRVERRRLGSGMVAHQVLYTDDLWVRNQTTRTNIAFDGRIEWGLADSPERSGIGALLDGWVEVRREDPSRGFVLAAEVQDLLFESTQSDEIQVRGRYRTACGRRTDVVAKLRKPAACPPTPASVLLELSVQRKNRGYRLQQDADPCDGCVNLSVDDSEEVRRFCPSVWSGPGAAFTSVDEAPRGDSQR